MDEETFNRTIVELKYVTQTSNQALGEAFNRTIVELKYARAVCNTV